MNLTDYINQHKLNKLNPDYQIEDFWYGFKNSIKNFYREYSKSGLDIDKISDELNKLKEEKNYNQIQEKIKLVIQIYCGDVMKYSRHDEKHHTNILMTNVKRWNKLSPEYGFKKYSHCIILTICLHRGHIRLVFCWKGRKSHFRGN